MDRKRRSFPTQGLMPLADIFIGATACIFILIIVARQAQQQTVTTTTPQADMLFSCAGHTPQEVLFKRLEPAPSAAPIADRKATTPSTLNADQLRDLLASSKMTERLALRVRLLAGAPPSRPCMKSFRSIVQELNRKFETPDADKRPASFVLLDMLPIAPHLPNESLTQN